MAKKERKPLSPETRAKQLANLVPFKKGKSGNPKGRPPSVLKTIIAQCKKEGFEPPKREDIRAALMLCLTANETQLKNLVKDNEKPMILRVIARSMLGDNGFSVIEKLLDRTVGKVVDLTSNDNPLKIEPLVVEVIDKTEQVDVPPE